MKFTVQAIFKCTDERHIQRLKFMTGMGRKDKQMNTFFACCFNNTCVYMSSMAIVERDTWSYFYMFGKMILKKSKNVAESDHLLEVALYCVPGRPIQHSPLIDDRL